MMKRTATNKYRNSTDVLSGSWRRMMALTVVLATPSAAVISMSTVASAVSPAPSHCEWNVAGEWSGYQTTGPSSASTSAKRPTGSTDLPRKAARRQPATSSGLCRTTRASFVVTWSNGPIGKYVGTISTEEMAGVTHQVGGDGQRFNWTVTGPGACVR